MPALDDDEFFRQCRYTDEIYRLTLGGSRPSSIRDQLEKACRFVRLAPARVEGLETLLVVGAGVAGVTAAWEAANLGIDVTLWDGKPQPFSAQVACSTRWLHPNEYRWPSRGFGDPYFYPDDASCFPPLLRWQAGIPSRIVTGWRYNFADWIDAPVELGQGSVTWDAQRELTLPGERAQMIPYFEQLGLGTLFNAVLLCIGGKETCSVRGSQHRGFYFWEEDDYGESNYGASDQPAAGRRTLISGGGDGAMQDYLRIACQNQDPGRPVHALWILDQLMPALQDCEPFRRLQENLARLSDPARPEPDELSGPLLAFFGELRTCPQRDRIEGALDRLIDPALLDGSKTLHLNFRHRPYEAGTPPIFKPVYTLNAFLVALFAWRIQTTAESPVFFPGARLIGVQSATESHLCALVPGSDGCLLQPHRVTFGVEDGDAGKPFVHEYDVIVIRHGIESPLPEPPR